MPVIEQSPPTPRRVGATPAAATAGGPRRPHQSRAASDRRSAPAARQARATPRRARVVAPKRAQKSRLASLEKFARTPKGYVLAALVVLLAVTLPSQGALAVQATIASVLAATLMDLVLRRTFVLPTSALLTGLFVGMVLDPHDALAVIVATSGGAIAVKHVVRTRRAHIFNPAAVALALAPPLFGAGESWWGATSGSPTVALIPLLVAGYVVVDRVNKFPSVLTFLSVYFAIFTGAVVLLPGEHTHLAQFYRDPFVGAVLFFAFFMLTDPPTSPVRPRDQMIFGAGVAVFAVTVELTRDTLTYMFLGLLLGNAWWAWRRVAAPRRAPATSAGVAAVAAPARQGMFLEKLLPGLRPVPGSRAASGARSKSSAGR